MKQTSGGAEGALVKLSEFWACMEYEFGAGYAPVLARDLVLGSLGHVIKHYYAVLAIVSNSYPPLPGRLPTRYSPVRNSSRRASSSFSVLLACIRHAASVHPEPGSNSH